MSVGKHKRSKCRYLSWLVPILYKTFFYYYVIFIMFYILLYHIVYK